MPTGSLTAVTAMLWTLIASLGGGLVAFVDAPGGRRHEAAELRNGWRTKIGALCTGFKSDLHEVRSEFQADMNGLAEMTSAEMSGKLDVVVSMAHTHTAAAGSPG